jgi:protein SCO1/2
LLPLTRQLGIAYRVEEHEAGQAAYQVDHSAGILLMNPEGRLHGVFPAPQSLEAMYRDLLRVLD